MLLQSYDEDIKCILSEGANHNKFLEVFGTRSINLKKLANFFSNFNPFPSMSSVATGDKKQFQYLQIVFSNKSESLIWNLIDAKTPFSFL